MMTALCISDELQPVPTWTRTLNEEDAIALLDLAQAGMSLEAWQEQGHAVLPQPSLPRRREQLRLVREELLDHDGQQILDSRFLRLFHGGSPHRRRTLFLGRLLRNRPVVHLALEHLVHPALARAETPLADEDADLISAADWDDLLYHHLPPDTGEPAFAKTRSTLQRALADVGVLELSGNTTRTTRVCRGRPEPLAYAWLIAHELRSTGRSEALEVWALHHAFPARLFAPLPEYAAVCLDEGVREGILRRGYLAGEPRLHPGEDL